MNRIAKIGFLLIISLSVMLFGYFGKHPIRKTLDNQKMNIQSTLGNLKSEGNFSKAINPVTFQFPEDAGPHPAFKSEWWYYTGNLVDSDDLEYGYQFTIFRQSISDKKMDTRSDWRTNQVYMAHLAVTDISNRQFYSHSKMTRGGVGLAGATSKPFHIWVENWEITGQHDKPVLKAITKNFNLELQLKSQKSIVLNGDRGVSQKSLGIGNASYYYSRTRIKTEGKLTIHGNKKTVSGESWLDREWSTSSLGSNEIGWDWFSIQLQDNREIMLYNIRQENGAASPFSSGTFTQSDGTYIHLKKNDFTIDVLDYWESKMTGIRYPSEWKIKLPEFKLNLLVKPKINNQEHQLQFVYWEGSVNVIGDDIKGNGYVELVGY